MKPAQKFILPKMLRQQDRVGVVAPAGPVGQEVLEKGLNVIRRMGWRPVLGRHVYSRDRFFAGTDEDRARDLLDMFQNPDIRAIFCARGGYGVARVLPHLKPALIRKNPKIVVGASDITLLLLYLRQRCSLAVFHGPMVAGNFGQYPMRKTKNQFQRILSGTLEKLEWPKARVVSEGSSTGEITGGCLTLVCRSLGTPYEIDCEGKILLLEDVNEAPYKVDGMLWQLKASGKFKEVKAVMVGEMAGCGQGREKNRLLRQSLEDVFVDESFPVITHLPLGHGREMWTIPFGVRARLDTGSKTLEFVKTR